MEPRGLLFIPDISGFTRFVNQTEIEHSRLIIQELLEILINANQLGLEVSEIEGDAILFYKFGQSPPLEDIYRQVEKMFCEFHKSLVAYDHRRFCQCRACISAIDLTLKVITHYGEFTGYNVKNFNKLIGKDIIVAHQLLKNDIEQHEYWLVTKNVLQDRQPAGFTRWMEWNSSAKRTESGEIFFHYTQLSPLKKEIGPDLFPQPDLSKKSKLFSVSHEYHAGIIPLFHAAGDFKYRSSWQVGVKGMEEINHFLPRVGRRCRCVMQSGDVFICSSSCSFTDERIEFSETNEKDQSITYYTLQKTSPGQTMLSLDFYIPKNAVQQLLFRLKKKKIEAGFQQSLSNLETTVKEIKLPPLNG